MKMKIQSLRQQIMKNPHKVLPQLLAASIAAMGYFCTGCVRGWSSPGVPSLVESKIVPLTNADAAWIASLPPLCALFGSLLISIPMTFFGRRKALMGLSIPFFIGFMCMGFSYFLNRKEFLYFGRILSGTMNGAATPAAQIYISECASPRIRGTLGSLTATLLALGILVAYIIGAFVEWYVLAWILGCFPLILFTGMIFMPETPNWLVVNKREEEARQSLQRLRGKRTNIELEFQRIKDNINKNNNQSNQPPKIHPRDLIKGSFLKPLAISMGLMFFQQFTGINAMVFYTVSIFKSAGSSIDKRYATIIVGFVQLICTACAAFLIDRFGRRMLLFMSASIVSLSLAAMGAYFFMQEKWGEADATAYLGWLPLLALIVFFIAYSIGFSNVPFVIMGELFPSRFRNLQGPLSSSFNLLCTFTVVRSFPDLQLGLGKYGAFWFYMCCTLCSIVFVFFLLPETKGRTLEEIEKLFSKKFNKDGSPKSVNIKEEMNPTDLENGPKTVAIISANGKLSDSGHDNKGYVGHSNDLNGYHPAQQLSLEPIDSEDEEEDDGVPVPTPL